MTTMSFLSSVGLSVPTLDSGGTDSSSGGAFILL